MLKVYEKPKLIVLSISSNDSLCAGCGFDVDDMPGLSDLINMAGESAFGPGEGCQVEISSYCKFTSSDKLFSS